MKRNTVFSYIKKRKYYLSLLGCLTVVAIALFAVYYNQNNNLEEIANLNDSDPVEDLVDNTTTHLVENEEAMSAQVPQKEISIHDEDIIIDNYQSYEPVEVIGEGSSNEEEVVDETTQDTDESITNDNNINEDMFNEELATEEEKMEAIPVIKVTQPNISFNATEKLSMPLNGDIILGYNDKVPAYFKTLDQYRINKALFIKGEVGTEVKAVADGVVEKIDYTEDKGNIITIYHGNGYKSVYGQLSDDLNVKEGDIITKGKIIGYIAEPTKFYSLEGSHLYYQFLKNEEAINPSEIGEQ